MSILRSMTSGNAGPGSYSGGAQQALYWHTSGSGAMFVNSPTSGGTTYADPASQGYWQDTGRPPNVEGTPLAGVSDSSPAFGGETTAPWMAVAATSAPAVVGQSGGRRGGWMRKQSNGEFKEDSSDVPGMPAALGREQGAWSSAQRSSSADSGSSEDADWSSDSSEHEENRPATESHTVERSEETDSAEPELHTLSHEAVPAVPVHHTAPAVPATAAATAAASPAPAAPSQNVAPPPGEPSAANASPGPNGHSTAPSSAGGRAPASSFPSDLADKMVANAPSSAASRSAMPSALDLGQVTTPTAPSTGSASTPFSGPARGAPVDLSMTTSGQAMTGGPAPGTGPQPSASTGSSPAGHPIAPMMGAGFQQPEQFRDSKVPGSAEQGIWDEGDGVAGSIGRPKPEQDPAEPVDSGGAGDFLDKLRETRRIR